MFGWLKGEPRCPVAPKAQAWLEGRVAWIVQEFGIERLRMNLWTRRRKPNGTAKRQNTAGRNHRANASTKFC